MTHFRTGILFASLFVILKILLFQAGKHDELYLLVVSANVLLALLAMIFGLRADVKSKGTKALSYLELVKSCMRPAAVYILMVVGFMYLYYGKIDREFFQIRVEERVEFARAADFDELKATYPEKLKDMTRDDFIDQEREKAELWYSPFLISTLTLMGLMVISLFYALVLAWAFRKFLHRFI